MVTDSKIIFFITFALFISLNSCNKNNDVIPDVYVEFSLDLNDPQFVNLSALGSSCIINAYTNNWPYSGGYDDNGIIIHSGFNEFFAYDRTCPHDYAVNGLSIKVNIDVSSSLYALCPKCSTLYSLPAGGTPAKGIGRYPLKNYKTNLYGNYVRVWNY